MCLKSLVNIFLMNNIQQTTTGMGLLKSGAHTLLDLAIAVNIIFDSKTNRQTPPTPKCGTPKGNFPFGVRFLPFLASQHRGGRLRNILKAI